MTAPSDSPAIPLNVIVINPRNDRIRAIVQGLFGPGYSVDVISNVWPSFPVDAEDLQKAGEATASATRQYETSLLRGLKRGVLAGQSRWLRQRLAAAPRSIVVCWNGIKGHRSLAMLAARELGHETLYLEEAPFSGRITVDRSGVNFGASLPRRIDFYHAWAEARSAQAGAWRHLGEKLVPRAASKRTDVQQADAPQGLGEENYIFCPLQVPGDSQLTVYGDWINTVDAMIDALGEASTRLPPGWHLRVKEHPSAKKSFGDKLGSLLSDRFRVDNSTNTMTQIAHSKGVLCVNSSVGLQTFFFDKPVVVLGHAFYGFDGLATKAGGQEALNALLSAPEALAFDARARDDFMNYLNKAFFPSEADIVAGRYTIEDLYARDQERAALSALL